jgi:hypothetical protein
MDEGAVLLFVAPAKRLTTLWSALTRRMVKAEKVPLPIAHPTLECARIGSKTIALVSWRSLLTTILTSLEDHGEGVQAADVRQLMALSDQMDDEAFFPLRGEELTSDTGRRITQYCALADDLVAKLVTMGIADTTGSRSAAGAGWYCRYHRFAGIGGSLQMSAYLWAEGRQTPLWLSLQYWWGKVNQEEQLDTIIAALSARGVDHHVNDWGCHIPLFLEQGAERDTVLDAAMKQLEMCAEIIGGAGMRRNGKKGTGG